MVICTSPFLFLCISQGASALFDMIEYYESATHLNISFNKHIGTRGWQAAALMMRKVRDEIKRIKMFITNKKKLHRNSAKTLKVPLVFVNLVFDRRLFHSVAPV